ncbi:MAG: transglycosylase SLT domain-containing protein [Lentisphaeria bacterium]|nr:transglycosylase SLT domain-containing protein [Lentisphaeria bacterium]
MRPPVMAALVLLLIFLIASGIWMLEHRRYTRQEIAAEIGRFSAKHRLPAALVYSVVEQESKFDSTAVGKAGEIGLMQLMPPGKPGAPEEWARVFKTSCPSRRQLFKIDCNINIGCWYLARALKKWRKYKHATELALVEYNAGAKQANLCKPETLDGEVIPRIKIASTKRYVIEIMERYRALERRK